MTMYASFWSLLYVSFNNRLVYLAAFSIDTIDTLSATNEYRPMSPMVSESFSAFELYKR